MAMSNVAPAPWSRPMGTVDKDGLSEIEVRKRRILKRTPMAAAAAPASQQALVDAGTVQRVGKGRPLVCQGEQASQIAMIGMGRLRLTRALADARTLSIGYRGTGDLVGEASLGGAPAYRETAVATEDVEALMVPVTTVRALVAADHAFGSGLLSMIIERHGDTEDRLASMLFQRGGEARRVPGEGRLALGDPGAARGADRGSVHASGDGEHDRVDQGDRDADARRSEEEGGDRRGSEEGRGAGSGRVAIAGVSWGASTKHEHEHVDARVVHDHESEHEHERDHEHEHAGRARPRSRRRARARTVLVDFHVRPRPRRRPHSRARRCSHAAHLREHRDDPHEVSLPFRNIVVRSEVRHPANVEDRGALERRSPRDGMEAGPIRHGRLADSFRDVQWNRHRCTLELIPQVTLCPRESLPDA